MSKNKMARTKKAQEEIVGFVLIVVIVISILVIILGISLRNSSSENIKESLDIKQFLESTLEYTTDCALSYEPAYSKLRELLQECNEGLSLCISGRKPCDVAKETLTKIADISFPVTPDSFIKSYEFTAIQTIGDTEKEILTITKGNCTQRSRGASLPVFASEGTITSSFKYCF